MSLGLLTSSLRVLKTLKSSTTEHSDRLLRLINDRLVYDGGKGSDGNHPQKRRSRLELVLLSCAVCGIEFCYAAETAFVSPTLLKIGVHVVYMSLIWCLSPILGFVLVPLLGSMSDRCKWRLGRRRPFILLLSVTILLGLVFVPNGEAIGRALGDDYSEDDKYPSGYVDLELTTSGPKFWNSTNGLSSIPMGGLFKEANGTVGRNNLTGMYRNATGQDAKPTPRTVSLYEISPHPWSILFTVLGVVMLDFSCDACQSPCRAYLLDVSAPEDHQAGLTTFTVMAGLGGSLGYVLGGVNWEHTHFGESLGGHVRVVFTIVLVIYIVCLALTVTAVKEVPLDQLGFTKEDLQKTQKSKKGSTYEKFRNEHDELVSQGTVTDYGTGKQQGMDLGDSDLNLKPVNPHNPFRKSTNQGDDHKDSLLVDRPSDFGQFGQESSYQDIENQTTTNSKILPPTDPSTTSKILAPSAYDPSATTSKVLAPTAYDPSAATSTKDPTNTNTVDSLDALPSPTGPLPSEVSLRTYLMSIVRMPRSLAILCLTNLWCWMSLVCYSLYFTDFVGQAVYGGNPLAPLGSEEREAYEDGVRAGSLAMSLYSLSCSMYSLSIEKLVEKIGAKPVYICSQLVYTIGAMMMAITQHKITVVLLSPCAGIMYATLFTMPYLLVAHYHANDTFHEEGELSAKESADRQVRGLGTDIALVSSMVFIAQFILSALMGTIVHAMASTVAVPICASVLSFLGAVTATQVVYLGL